MSQSDVKGTVGVKRLTGEPARNERAGYRLAAPKHPVRWTIQAFLLLLLAALLASMIKNPRFGWGIVGDYVFDQRVLDGILVTLMLTMIAMAIGLTLGTAIALMRVSNSVFFRAFGVTYVWLFRSIPPLVQLILWYNLGALYSYIVVKVPLGPTLFEQSTNSVISPLTAAILGLGLSQAGYSAEAIRGGLLSVDSGQYEAARAIGLSGPTSFYRVVAPQAIRVILPVVGNEFISMLKLTSLVSVIALPELLYSVQLIYSRTYETVPMLLTACVWYLVLVSLLSYVQYLLEKRFGKGTLDK